MKKEFTEKSIKELFGELSQVHELLGTAVDALAAIGSRAVAGSDWG